jgi:hypothetical protein
MADKIVYQCRHCHDVHEGLPSIAFDAPCYYHLLSKAEQTARTTLTSDLCSVDEEEFFVRAVLEIPVIGYTERLVWGVWGSLSRASFERYSSTFGGHDQGKLEPMFSWFASRLPDYPETLSLRCRMVPRNDRLRPVIEFAPDQEHALIADAESGISLERAIAFVMPVLHRQQ